MSSQGRARRLTPFERDFADLHGRLPRRVAEEEVIEHDQVRSRRVVERVDHPGARLVFGVLGAFWSIVLGGALVVMLVVGWAFVSTVLGL